MTPRTDPITPSLTRRGARQDQAVPGEHPIAFASRPSLGERIIAAARVAAAMHMTGSALIEADEAAIDALDSREASA